MEELVCAKWDAESLIYGLHMSISKRSQNLTKKLPVMEGTFRQDYIEKEVSLLVNAMFSDIYDSLAGAPINLVGHYMKNNLLTTSDPEDHSTFIRLVSAQYLTSEVISQVEALRNHTRHFMPVDKAYEVAIKTVANRLGSTPFKGLSGRSFQNYATSFVRDGKDGVLPYWQEKKEI